MSTTPQQSHDASPAAVLFASVIERGADRYLKFRPHGYEFPIVLPVITSGSRDAARAWTWNGSTDTPTLKPSIKTTHANGTVSHIWLTDGMCQHLGDSTDGFAGQTLPLLSLANAELRDRSGSGTPITPKPTE